MPRALWLLVWLQLRGWGRYLASSVKTVRGAILAGVGLFVTLSWVLSALAARFTAPQIDQEQIPFLGPTGLLAYCLLNVLSATGERSIVFSPAEVNFLFPAPFTRRQLLAYKVTVGLLLCLPGTVVLTVISSPYSPSVLGAFVGLYLMFAFMQLFTYTINLAALTVGARFYTRARWFIITALAVLALLVLWQAGIVPWRGGPRNVMGDLQESVVWKAVTYPLTFFFDAFLARTPLDLLRSAALGALVNLVLLAVLFLLDAQYLEASALASARLYSRLQQLRKNQLMGIGPTRWRWRVPMPPRLGGVGPIAWRQLTTAVRMPGRFVTLFVLFLLVAVGGFFRGPTNLMTDAERSLLVAGMLLMMPLVFTALLPFDFRGDLDRIAVLKTLPIPAWRLALGQLLTPAVLVSLVQCVVLALVLLAGGVLSQFEGTDQIPLPSDMSLAMPVLLAGMALTLPFNLLAFALENFLFLLFPMRLFTTPGDFQAMGRGVLFSMAKLFVLSLVVLVTAVASMLAYLLLNRHFLAGAVTAWLCLAVASFPFFVLVGIAFERFDVTRDTPP